MAGEHTKIIHVTERSNGEPCIVNPIGVKEEIARMKRAGWKLVSCDPVDENQWTMQVTLTFKKKVVR